MKIGFQGDIGSNSEEATKKFIKILNFTDAIPVGLITSKNVVTFLLNKEIDFGVMAIRNSIIGEVIETKNALTPQIELLKTVEIPIHHCVFTKHSKVKISCIASHIQALQQTALTRKRLLPDIPQTECIDTALAAKMLFDGDYPDDHAVICRKNAGEHYNLHLFAENIEDNPNNKTTFGLFKLK